MIWGNTSHLGKMDCFGVSDGGGRGVNTDQFLIADLKRLLLVHRSSLTAENASRRLGDTQGQLLMVADGFGGEAGLRASALVVDAVSEYLLNTANLRAQATEPAQFLIELQHALLACQTRIQTEQAARPATELAQSGTCVTVAYIAWPKLFLTHAGDCRCYLLREGRLRQLTKDHTFAQRMVELGILEPEKACRSQWNTVLWNVIGPGTTELDPDANATDLRIGDTLLLCTNGLTRNVADSEIARILGSEEDAKATCHQLIAAAKAAKATDDVTVIVARFRSTGDVDYLLADAGEALDEPIQPPAAGHTEIAVTESAGTAESLACEVEEPSTAPPSGHNPAQ